MHVLTEGTLLNLQIKTIKASFSSQTKNVIKMLWKIAVNSLAVVVPILWFGANFAYA